MNELLERMNEVDQQRKELADEVAVMLTRLIDATIERLGVKVEIGGYIYDKGDCEFCADYTLEEELIIRC